MGDLSSLDCDADIDVDHLIPRVECRRQTRTMRNPMTADHAVGPDAQISTAGARRSGKLFV